MSPEVFSEGRSRLGINLVEKAFSQDKLLRRRDDRVN
jgi:hypothetical protein